MQNMKSIALKHQKADFYGREQDKSPTLLCSGFQLSCHNTTTKHPDLF